MSSDFLKVVLDGVIALVNGIDSLISTFGTIPTLLTAFATFNSFTGDGFFKTVIDEADSSSKKMTNIFSEGARQSRRALENIGLKGNSEFKDSLYADIEAFNNWRNELSKGPPEKDAFSNIFKNASEAARQYAESGKLAAEGIDEFVNSQKKVQVSTLAQNKTLSNARTIIKEYFSGCQNVSLSQKDFADAVSKTNPKLGAQLKTAKSGKSALVGYGISLVGATIKTVALEAATMALNAAMTMGISFLISAGISALTKWINAEKELAEEVESLTSEYKEQHKALKDIAGDYDTSNEKSMISRYEKLSKGVDNLGKNVSLTADEYSEYQSIVNKIADQIPSLVSGYDSQGNAILSCKGNVEELTAAYEGLITAQNREVLSKAGEIEEDFENKRKDIKSERDGLFGSKISYNRYKDYSEILKNAEGDIEDTDTALENLFDKIDNIDDPTNGNYLSDVKALSNALEDAGFEREGSWWNKETLEDHIKRAFRKDKDAVKTVLNDYIAGVEAEVEESRTIAQAVLSDAFDISSSGYYGMSDTLQNVANQVVNNLDFDFFDKLKNDGKTVRDWTNEMLGQLNSLNKNDVSEIEAAFNLQTKFNNKEISYGDYVSGLESAWNTIDSLGLEPEVESQIKLSLGLDEDGFVEQYDNLLARLSGKNKDGSSVLVEGSNPLGDKKKIENLGIALSDAKKLLDGLSAEELSIAAKIIPNVDAGTTAKEIEAAISREMAVQGLTFDLNLEVETAGIDALNTAMAESVSATGLSSDSITALKGRYAELEEQGYDLSAMFEETSNGIHLNKNALGELEKEYAKQKQDDILSDLNDLEKEYKLLTKDIDECTDTGERASLYTQRDAILQQINDAATLAAQYEGLTSAYNDWQRAESSGSERDMYENILSGFETIDDEIARGWYDDGTIEFLELLTGKDLSTADIDTVKTAYKGLNKEIKNTGYTVRDFFTVDDDGNSTTDGIYNFLEAVETLEKSGDKSSTLDKVFKNIEGIENLVTRDDEGRIVEFDFNVAGGDKAIADALGISEELVQIIQRAAEDAGFVVTLDGKWTQWADLKTHAEESNNALKKFKSEGLEALKDIDEDDLNFNFAADNAKDLQTELEKSLMVLDKFKKDGKIDLEMDGAQEALDIAEFFTITMDKLSEPAYMKLETNQVEEELQEPLKKMQEFEDLVKEKHLLTLTGDTEGLEDVEKEMNEIVDYIYENDDLKARLEIEGLTKEEIKEKLEQGEIEIPATVDIQLEMSDDLKDMRLMMMNQLGLVTDEQVKLEIQYDVDASAVEEYEPETQKAIVEYFETHEEVDEYLPEQKEAIVKLIANDVDLDNYDADTKEAVVNYVAETEDVDNWSPAKKDAIVTFYANTDDLDSYTPQQKEAIVNYLAGTKSINDYDPDDKKAVVKFLNDSTLPDSYQPDPKTGYVSFSVSTESPVLTWKPPTVYGDASYTPYLSSTSLPSITGLTAYYTPAWESSGTGPAAGTAHVGGSTGGRAFACGNWGIQGNGVALGGELGREIVVRDGKFFTIGDEGAEFFRYKKNDIVFNAAQTESLFKYGGIKGANPRGKMLATGTAFAEGNAFSEGTCSGFERVGSNSVTGKVYYKSKDSETSDKESQETLDWIETAIQRIEREIDILDKKAGSTYRSWSERNKALTDELSTVREEITLQETAWGKYMQAANAVGLDESYAKKVREGTLDIETIDDEALKEKIQDYEKWYELALACNDAILDLQENQNELLSQKFDNIITQYESLLGVIDHEKSMLDEYISQAEAQGQLVSGKYYEALIKNENQNISTLEKEKLALLAELSNFKEGTEERYNKAAEIDAVTLAIEQGKTSIYEYQQSIQELDFERFDLLQEKISAVTEEADFLIELMSNKKLFDDSGQLTDEGQATMGLHGQNYNVNMSQADDYAKKVAELNKQIAEDPYDNSLIAKRDEYLKKQREHIFAAEDEKNAIRDLVEEGINVQLDALQELIDKKNEALDSERDLYEYQKKVKEQTKEIASLEKQLSAYAGDDSEEARQKVQQLKVDLESAQQDLQESEYDKMISDASAMLDNLYLEYKTILNARLDNINTLISSVIDSINGDAGSIKATLTEQATAVGASLSTTMTSIWAVEGEAGKAVGNVGTSVDKVNTSVGGVKNVITEYGKNFSSAQTTTNEALNDIKLKFQSVINLLDKEAAKKVQVAKTSSATKSKSSSSSSSSSQSNKSKSSGGDGKPKIGDKVKYVSGQYYYDSQGKKPLGTHKKGQYVYITNINEKSWATHGYHISTGNKLGKGDLGWLKLNQLSGYATGKKGLLSDEIAWTQEEGREFIVRPSDGAILTPVAKRDSILNTNASNNIWDMANSPAEFIKDNLDLGTTNVPNNSTTQSNLVQNFDQIVFSMPNVKNYNELLSEMQRDPKFEKLVLAMSIDRIAGKSALAKNKAIR